MNKYKFKRYKNTLSKHSKEKIDQVHFASVMQEPA